MKKKQLRTEIYLTPNDKIKYQAQAIREKLSFSAFLRKAANFYIKNKSWAQRT